MLSRERWLQRMGKTYLGGLLGCIGACARSFLDLCSTASDVFWSGGGRGVTERPEAHCNPT